MTFMSTTKKKKDLGIGNCYCMGWTLLAKSFLKLQWNNLLNSKFSCSCLLEYSFCEKNNTSFFCQRPFLCLSGYVLKRDFDEYEPPLKKKYYEENTAFYDNACEIGLLDFILFFWRKGVNNGVPPKSPEFLLYLWY